MMPMQMLGVLMPYGTHAHLFSKRSFTDPWRPQPFRQLK
jgi:hypothetical protein